MMRTPLVLLLGCLTVECALAQSASNELSLYTVQGNVETPVLGQLFDFGSVANGDSEDVVFRLRYTGTANPYYLTYFSCCSGTGFSVIAKDWQNLPATFPAGGYLDFTVSFQPVNSGTNTEGYSANLTIQQNPTVFLTGKGTPGLTLLLNNQPVAAGQTISFGSVQVGSTNVVQLMLANQTPGSLTVPSIQPLANSAFKTTGPAVSRPTVPPGSSVELDVTFAPTVTGPQQATLTLGVASFVLQGTGTAPPPPLLPQPSVQLNLPVVASAQQGTIGITLAAPCPADASGTVSLAFQQAAAGGPDDPTVAFSDGSGSASFTVAKGATTGHFGTGPSASFGSGTTAGTLVFTVTFGANTVQKSIAIPSAMIGIDAAVAARNVGCAPSELYCTTTNIELQINGWDNTRTASQIVFSFYDASGKLINPGNLSVDGTAAFQQYFATSSLGGVFAVHALFPVTGDVDQIVTAAVQLTNAAGTAQSARIDF